MHGLALYSACFFVDCTDTYLHIPLVSHHHFFFAFLAKYPYQWRVLPFSHLAWPQARVSHPLQLCIDFADYVSFSSVQFPCGFFFLIRLSLWMLCQVIRPSIFRVLAYPYHFVEPGQGLCVMFQHFSMNYGQLCKMLHRIDFCLCSKVLPYIWIIVPLKII